MTKNRKQKNLWLTKLFLIGGLFGAIFLAGLDKTQAATTAGAETASVSVTASVALSDYFADLLATASTVTASTTPDRSVVIGIQVRSDEQQLFPNHPLTIRITNVASGKIIETVSRKTGQAGRLTVELDTENWLSGIYRVQVIDYTYSHPIPLAAEPYFFIELKDDHQPSAQLQSSSGSNSFGLNSIQFSYQTSWYTTSSYNILSSQLIQELSLSYQPNGHDP